ncbi:MAG: hypothetical protein AAGC67_21005, partial [Myxococcota bacterium]
MPPDASAETRTSEACRVVVRSVDGPVARELFLLGEPSDAAGDAAAQARAVYAGLDDALAARGAAWSDAIRETIFLASSASELAVVRAARAAVVDATCPPPLAIEQPPL